MIKKVLFILFLLVNFSFAQDFYITTFANKVVDGDTIYVYINNLNMKVRFLYIDAFETRRGKRAKNQSIYFNLPINEIIKKGKESKQYVTDLLLNKIVCLKINSKNSMDMYGRLLAEVYNSPCSEIDNTSISVNKDLLNKKLAVKIINFKK